MQSQSQPQFPDNHSPFNIGANCDLYMCVCVGFWLVVWFFTTQRLALSSTHSRFSSIAIFPAAYSGGKVVEYNAYHPADPKKSTAPAPLCRRSQPALHCKNKRFKQSLELYILGHVFVVTQPYIYSVRISLCFFADWGGKGMSPSGAYGTREWECGNDQNTENYRVGLWLCRF